MRTVTTAVGRVNRYLADGAWWEGGSIQYCLILIGRYLAFINDVLSRPEESNTTCDQTRNFLTRTFNL